ncbi:EamA family transporter [Microbacterium sp. GCS4]|uniref:EamA family transporter n=1 Tax=Microbacterium sp. GCS4 TaxID=1692239 RepID=UPI0006802319|nr:DMT family transporter [Microbacterium sp. GCS4]KNY04159.1 membrane protein [Microbacterium sp. GCS4]
MSRTRNVGLILAVVACAAFATSGPVAKSLMEAGLEPQQASWMRLTGAALILLPVVIILRGKALAATWRSSWRLLIAYGAVGMAASQTLFFYATSLLPVGVAILLQFSGPLLIIGWTKFVRRTHVPRSAVIGVTISLLGLVVVVEVWTGLAFDVWGVLAGIGSAVCQAAYFLLIEDLKDSSDVLVMTASGTAVAAVLLSVTTLPWTFPWHVLTGDVVLAGNDVSGWIPFFWLVLICAIFAYLLEGAAVRRLSAVIGGAIAYVEVVFAAVIAWLLLGEGLGAAQILGGVLVIAGAYIAQRPAKKDGLDTTDQLEFPGMVGADAVIHKSH